MKLRLEAGVQLDIEKTGWGVWKSRKPGGAVCKYHGLSTSKHDTRESVRDIPFHEWPAVFLLDIPHQMPYSSPLSGPSAPLSRIRNPTEVLVDLEHRCARQLHTLLSVEMIGRRACAAAFKGGSLTPLREAALAASVRSVAKLKPDVPYNFSMCSEWEVAAEPAGRPTPTVRLSRGHGSPPPKRAVKRWRYGISTLELHIVLRVANSDTKGKRLGSGFGADDTRT
jgi:hypothetical protein